MKTVRRCKTFTIQFAPGSGRNSQLLRTFDVGDTDYLEITSDEHELSLAYIRRPSEVEMREYCEKIKANSALTGIPGSFLTPHGIIEKPEQQVQKIVTWRSAIIFECMYEGIVD